MTAAYYSILTNNGKALIANATVSTPIGFSDIAVGDGNGSVPTPLETRTALVNEKARFTCNSVALNPNNTNWIEAEIIIPTTSGGYTIRELGLYAGATLVAVANFPSTYKPLETEGSAREIAIKMVINVQNAEVISVTLDNSLIYATRDWVNTYYIPRTDIVDNLTTNDAAKPISAKQAKVLQDNKLAKTENAVSASKLATARNIDGIAFDGSDDISLINTSYGFANTGLGARAPTFTSGLDFATSAFRTQWYSLAGTYLNGPIPGTITGLMLVSVQGYTVTPSLVFQLWRTGGDYWIGYAGSTVNANGTSTASSAITWKNVAYTDSNITGNAATATKLATARKIGGVSFDGSADINLPFGFNKDSTRVDITSSFVLNTTYTNTNNKPIYFTATCNLDDALMRLTVGTTVLAGNGDNGSTNYNIASISMIILPGETYSLTCTKALTYAGYII